MKALQFFSSWRGGKLNFLVPLGANAINLLLVSSTDLESSRNPVTGFVIILVGWPLPQGWRTRISGRSEVPEPRGRDDDNTGLGAAGQVRCLDLIYCSIEIVYIRYY